MTKKRLDLELVERSLAESRERARAIIMAGDVLVNDFPVDKPGVKIAPTDRIAVKGNRIPYVGRGGLKLKGGIDAFHLNVQGCVCLDVGASTGGFTDCLLQHGARKVYAVDVGYGQLAWSLRRDDRVAVIERTNIRYMPDEKVPEPVDLITIDVSFISLTIVVPAVLRFMKPESEILALVKPQFEVGRGKVGKGGVVRDAALHQEVVARLTEFFLSVDLEPSDFIPSPVLGPKGNKEYLALLKPAW